MRTKIFRVAILIFASLVLFIRISNAESTDRKSSQIELEEVAKNYMTAFFLGDLSTAANFTHPDTLNELRRSFLQQLDNAKTAGQDGQFLAQMNIKKDSKTLKKLNSKELYVVLIESDRSKRNETLLQEMKKTTVEVDSSKLLQNGEATVQLKMTSPTVSGTQTQRGGLLLARTGGKWKVKGNSQ